MDEEEIQIKLSVLFLDCDYSGQFCFKNKEQKIADKIAIFSSCSQFQENRRHRGLFLKIIFSINKHKQHTYDRNLLFEYYCPKISTNRFYRKLKHHQQLYYILLEIGYAKIIALKMQENEKQPIKQYHQATEIRNLYKNFNQQPTKQQQQQSNEIKQKLLEMAESPNENQQQLSIPLLVLSQILQKYGNNSESAKVIFHHKRNQKTKKTIQALSNFLYYKSQPIFEQFIQSHDYKYSYSEISQDTEKLQEFQQWFKRQTAKKYNVNFQSVQILQIRKKCIAVKYRITKQIQPNTIHQFFKFFHLTPDLFSLQGNKVYAFQKHQQQYGKIDFRGGWPYFLPVKCKRYGLNVRGNYDNGNDDWLQMNNQPGQWAIAFHGVERPQQTMKATNKTRFQNMMSGLGKDKTVFKVISQQQGGRHACKEQISVNTNQRISYGIYCTPHLSTAVQYSGSGGYISSKKECYYLIFMCRVNPNKIKVSSAVADYFVINSPQDIRPYGIILVKEKDLRNFPSAQELYGKKAFKWESYGRTIKQNLLQKNKMRENN